MLAIVGTVGVPACYGGFETLVENLLDENDEQVLVYCSAHHYSEQLSTYKNARLVYLKLKANGLQSIPYDMLSVIDAIRKGATTVLVLGVSGALILPFVKLFTKVKIVTNIDGLEWRRDKWNKLAKAYLKFAERVAVRCSHAIVSDNQAIADYVQQEYAVESSVIAYGGDHALIRPNQPDDHGYGFSVCRIEPENNVHLILEAHKGSERQLKFVGNWNNSEYGRQLKAAYASEANIELLDPIYDLEALFTLRSQCGYYLHGHSAGGTNPSLVEMMHFGKPTICFDCNYNRATTEDDAKYFGDVQQLKQIIAAPSFPQDLTESAASMMAIAKRRYTWSIVKQQYFDLLK